MNGRLRRLWRNAGPIGCIQGLIGVAIFAAAAALALSRGNLGSPALFVPVLFGVMWFARDWMVVRAGQVIVALRLVFLLMIALVVFHKQIAAYLSFWTPIAVFSVVGLYLGAWFWLFSDWRVRIER